MMSDLYCGPKQTHASTGTVFGGQDSRTCEMEVEITDSQLSKVNHWLALLFFCCFGTYLHPPWQGLPPGKASGITADQTAGLLSGRTGEYYLDYTERSGKILCHPRFTTEIPILLFQHLHPVHTSAQKSETRRRISAITEIQWKWTWTFQRLLGQAVIYFCFTFI